MNASLPSGSKITTQFDNGYHNIIIPHKKPGITRYFFGLFIIFWLGGWAVGWVTAVMSLRHGADPFLTFWLGGWTIGGFFAMYMLYRLFRKPIPEQLMLNTPTLSYDSGIPPLDMQMQFGRRHSADYWRSLFFKRKRLQFSLDEVKSLRLRETDSGNRLTIDQGNERIELGTGATEIEREWLYELLKNTYG